MKPAKTLNVIITADLRMRHSGLEMGQKSRAWNFFYFAVFLEFSLTFYVDSYALTGSSGNEIDSSLWDTTSERNNKERFDSSPKPAQTNWGDAKGPSGILQRPLEDITQYDKWLKVLAFDKSYNLSETDRGTNNESKIIVISEEDHLDVYEDDEEEKGRTQLQENILDLLNSKNFLSHKTVEKQSGDLERTKRQAEEAPAKRRCKCRRQGRRTGGRRRRQRRRRNGRQRRRRQRRGRRRRTGRRRGRRRCICRSAGGEEGKSDGEESEGEDPEESGDGEEEGGEEGGDEGGEGGEEEGEEDGEEGSGEEDEGDEDEDDEGSDENNDSDDDEEKEEGGKDPPSASGGELVSPGNSVPVPPGTMVVVPGQGMAYPMPYPNTIPYPNTVYYPSGIPSIGAVPVGRKP